MNSTRVRVALVGVMIAGLGTVLLVDYVRAAGDAGTRDKIIKIAKAIQSGDKATVDKLSKEVAKSIEEFDEIMNLMKLRSKKGFGVGSKPGAIMPDGIELRFTNIEEKGISKEVLKKEGEALVDAAYIMAAIAEVAQTRGWQEEKGKKTKKAWASMSKDMKENSIAAAEALKGGDPDKIKAAVTKLGATCTSCHQAFKP